MEVEMEWSESQPLERGRAREVVGLVTLLVALLVGGPLHAQEPVTVERVTIKGTVLDEISRLPLEGVLVYFVQLDAGIETDASGQFEVKGIPIGIYEMVLDHAGYRSSQGNFTVDQSGEFTLTLTPLEVEGETTAGRFAGRLTDVESDEPVIGAEVRIPELFLSGVTSGTGRFEMPAVPPGRYAVEFSSLGYATRVDTIGIVSGQTTDARVRLSLDPLVIDPIEVSVEPREYALEGVGFYQRRTVGFGEFIDRVAIEERNPHKLTDLLRSIPGARLVAVPPAGSAVVLRGGRVGFSDEQCFPKVVLDGIVVDRSPDAPALLDQLVDPEMVAGIEVFPSSAGIPIQYAGTNTACGVILVWTRKS